MRQAALGMVAPLQMQAGSWPQGLNDGVEEDEVESAEVVSVDPGLSV